jgi:hypothetical protein
MENLIADTTVATWQPTVDGVPILDSNGYISVWLTSFDGEPRFGKCLTRMSTLCSSKSLLSVAQGALRASH